MTFVEMNPAHLPLALLLEADPGLSRPEHAPLLGRVRRLFAQHGDMFN